MYDVFISYRRAGGVYFARLLRDNLEARGLRVFFDYEELQDGHFNEKIYTAIEESKNFIIVLAKDSLDRCSNEGDWVKNEILCALKKGVKIIPVKLDEFVYPEKQTLGELDEIRYIQAVPYNPDYHDEAIDKIVERLEGISASSRRDSTERDETIRTERIENKYFITDDKAELRRLTSQKKLLQNFDREVYGHAIESYEKLVILDVGSNRGDLVMDRFGKAENLDKIIGLEYDDGIVQEANARYGKEGQIKFYQVDLEKPEMVDAIETIMEEMQIDGFNIIHISMLLLHLKKAYNLLKNLRKYLTSDGVLIIKDIDDGLNLAYPDEQGRFKRVIDICGSLETAGFRQSGRQIYTLLKRAGYRSVKLENCGIDTIEMSFDDREALFDTYFSFILGDSEIMKDRHPENRLYAENYEWMKENYDTLEEDFQEPSFYFNLGFMLFTAKK